MSCAKHLSIIIKSHIYCVIEGMLEVTRIVQNVYQSSNPPLLQYRFCCFLLIVLLLLFNDTSGCQWQCLKSSRLLPEKLRQCLLQDSIPPRVQCLSIQPAPVDGTEGSHADLGVKSVESLDPPCQELPFMTIKYNIIHTSLLITNIFTYNNFTNSFQKWVRISKEMPPWPTP